MNHLCYNLAPDLTVEVLNLRLINVAVISHGKFQYDGLGLWGCPEWIGVATAELWATNTASKLNDPEKLSFMQLWLYFKLAHEVAC
jgi:hypothetical protein